MISLVYARDGSEVDIRSFFDPPGFCLLWGWEETKRPDLTLVDFRRISDI